MKETSSEIASKYKPSTQTDFSNMRGQVLHAYIHLERATGDAFEFAVGARVDEPIQHKRATIAKKAFSTMMKSNHRYFPILKDIANLYLPKENQLFVDGLVKELKNATDIRNCIAHDETSNIIGDDGLSRSCIDRGIESKPLYIEDLVEYKKRLKYLFYALYAYNGLLFSGKPDWIEEDLYQELVTTKFEVSFEDGAPLVKAGVVKK